MAPYNGAIMLEETLPYRNHLGKVASNATHPMQLICDPYIRPLQHSRSTAIGSDTQTLVHAKSLVEADLGAPVLAAHYVGREDFWVPGGHCLDHAKSRVGISYTVANPNKGKRGEPADFSFTHYVWLADWLDHTSGVAA